MNMTPLLIVKINTIKPSDALARDMETIAEGIKKGCLVLSGDCEVIAFDGEGRLAYPIRPEEVAAK